MAKKSISKLAAQVPQNDEQLSKLLTATILAQTDREAAIAARDAAEAKAKAELEAQHQWGAIIAERDIVIARNLEVLETWCAVHKEDRFGKAKSITLNQHRFGWRLGNWKTVLAKGVKWEAVIAALQRLIAKGKDSDASEKAKERAALAKEYLAIKIAPDKESMLRDRHLRPNRALLKVAGVGFEQDENFYLEPDREGQDGATLTAGGVAS